MRLHGKLVRVCDLASHDRAQMFHLMDRHYENLCPAEFDADLDEKQWVIQILEHATGRLRGFSTQMLLDAVVDDRPVRALFSGDTIIDRRYWGDQALTHVWGRLALELMHEDLDRELYWFLLSQGYKTYRFLPVFFHEFYPRYDAAPPQWFHRTVDALGRRKCGERYDATAGVVRASRSQYRLRGGVADVTSQRRHDPHVRFFVERNPGHASGDELCCIAPLTPENFTPAAYRVIGLERSAAEALPCRS